MNKAEYARKIWFNRTQGVAGAAKYKKLMDEPKWKREIRRLKYYFYNFLFQLALIEFKLNLFAGKSIVAVFNLVNFHKIRVNRIVNEYAEKCRETTKV
jgi:hypothetical protein